MTGIASLIPTGFAARSCASLAQWLEHGVSKTLDSGSNPERRIV